MKKQLLLLLGLIFLLSITIKTQTPSNDLVLRVTADEGDRMVLIDSKADAVFTDSLRNLLLDKKNYELFEMTIEDDGSSKTQKIDLNRALETPTSIICNDFNGCTLVRLRFKEGEKLSAGKNYLLRIAGVNKLTANQTNNLPIYFKFPPPKPPVTATINGSNDGSRRKIQVQASEKVTFLSNLDVTRKTLKIADNNKQVETVEKIIPAKVSIDGETPVTTPITEKEVTLLLDKKLAESATHDLVVKKGISDSSNKNVTPKGKIEIAGLPKKPDEAWLDIRLNTQGAVHQKPFFDLFFKYNAQNQLRLGSRCLPFIGKDCYWQPQISVDIGAGNSKSNNSVIFDMSFRTVLFEQNKRIFDINDQKEFSGIEKPLANYYGWKKTHWYKGATFLYFGPKIETDKKFERVNALGTLRLELKQHRLLGSIAHQKTYLAADLSKEEVKQVVIDSGFTLVPFVGIDFGRKVSAEVVENKKAVARAVIPPNNIFRSYLGFNSTLEWKWGVPMNLSLEEKLSYLSRTETIGLVIPTGIGFRKVKGFQPRSVATFNIFLDNARRYSFNITWENGRKEPLFEYLNKVSSGFKVTY